LLPFSFLKVRSITFGSAFIDRLSAINTMLESIFLELLSIEWTQRVPVDRLAVMSSSFNLDN
jgi:hypothetical protein